MKAKGLLVSLMVCASGILFPAEASRQHHDRLPVMEPADTLEVVGDAVGLADGEVIILGDTLRERTLDEIVESLPPFAYNGPSANIMGSLQVFHGYFDDSGIPPGEINLEIDSLRWTRPFRGLKMPVKTPSWIDEATIRFNTALMLKNMRMTSGNMKIDYLFSQLPTPPKLMKLSSNFSPDAFRVLPGASAFKAKTGVIDIGRTHWIHDLVTNMQFSQAYISPNWYQGGDNSLTVLASFLWNVKINSVYHPNLLIESNLQYKLGLFSTPKDSYHKYSISEDNFQWNAKFGFKAFKKRWFYSLTVQFKTPLLNNYEQNGPRRISSFLSQGELNLGVGLTYSITNSKKTITFGASLSPLSYNLKTCIDSRVDHAQFNISQDKKSRSEIGSNAELNLLWKIAQNITYSSRLFLFSNYQSFTGDWENTVSFAINRFFSTQIYVHGRFDTSSEISHNKWKHWMLKEIFSFGFSYSFFTKPPKK